MTIDSLSDAIYIESSLCSETTPQSDQPFVHALLFLKNQLKEIQETQSLLFQTAETSYSSFSEEVNVTGLLDLLHN